MAKSPSFDEEMTLPDAEDDGGMQVELDEAHLTQSFLVCGRGDDSCEAIALKYGLPIIVSKSVSDRRLTPPEFRYTTPSVRKARGEGWNKAKRLELCEMVEAFVFDKKGKRKAIQKFSGKLKDGARVDSRCKGSLSDPCSGNKGKTSGSCPVELESGAGVGHLRLCESPKKGGKLLKFEDRDEAFAIGTRACMFWRENGTFEGLPMAKDAPFGGIDDDDDEDRDELLFGGFRRAAEMLKP